MSRSDIFDSFVKIAKEKGMINDSDDAKKKLEQSRRVDSLSISDIEALYGVKPDMPKSMEYENNIIENAHPNSIVISPSYDKLNGLVENNNERQNIILNILNKTPDGQLTQRKYAESAFISSLVSVANDLDNRDKDELRVLADACLMQTYSKNKLKKVAVPAIPVILAVVGVFGAIYAHQHLPNLTTSMKEDYDNLMSQLDDFLNSSVSWYGTGKEYDKALIDAVKGFEDRLKQFWTIYEPIDAILREMEVPRNADEMKKIIDSPKSTELVDAFNKMKRLMENISPYINKVEQDFKSSAYKAHHTKEKGMLTSLLEKSHLAGGATSLFADDFQDVVNAIGPFRSEVANLLEMFKGAKTLQEKLVADLKESQTKDKSEYAVENKAPSSTQSDPLQEAKDDAAKGLAELQPI